MLLLYILFSVSPFVLYVIVCLQLYFNLEYVNSLLICIQNLSILSIFILFQIVLYYVYTMNRA